MAFDATFWALIGLILFLAVVMYFKAPAMAARSLDSRAKRIENEMEEARELKEEAKRQLADYQRRRREAEAEAREIVASAQREAAGLVEEARIKSEEYVARRTQVAEQKISQAEADAIAEVRASAVNIAIDAATRVITERNLGTDGQMTERSIEEVRRRLN
ncbi:F0F1 ATP synthase subunit B [Aureimonas phyllosphaerae]|uniref:ATP synthase subunit b n=1 Tax=Aureimonas phyllosphaerae TaxID=1166078 RepID=A0A7W6FSU3_9HYPH|nr:F0F1 ATP synthase subunit B [Aureimonas phyllosphaerae]MBB3934323.1 F-type H+-transporting ATPase subunit b [Aureimonas phyllosphaerae]MBB3958461.1 F-type H+-transporting ATPase subunit b [Aureimonas phyllosphaerae]SFE97483.1 F-type H+-transporting ATPase subunit b [Aureimonas phyllosphaerae]